MSFSTAQLRVADARTDHASQYVCRAGSWYQMPATLTILIIHPNEGDECNPWCHLHLVSRCRMGGVYSSAQVKINLEQYAVISGTCTGNIDRAYPSRRCLSAYSELQWIWALVQKEETLVTARISQHSDAKNRFIASTSSTLIAHKNLLPWWKLTFHEKHPLVRTSCDMLARSVERNLSLYARPAATHWHSVLETTNHYRGPWNLKGLS